MFICDKPAFLKKRMSQRKWYSGGVRNETGIDINSSVSLCIFKMKLLALQLFVVLVYRASEAHEYYDGACPDFPPIKSLDWDRWASGAPWRAAFKHNSRSSCIRCSPRWWLVLRCRTGTSSSRRGNRERLKRLSFYLFWEGGLFKKFQPINPL